MEEQSSTYPSSSPALPQPILSTFPLPKTTYHRSELLKPMLALHMALRFSTVWCWPIAGSPSSLGAVDVPYGMFATPNTGTGAQHQH